MGGDERPGFPRCSRGHRKKPSAKRRGWALLSSEPFRIFFPAGLLTATYGVSLWPMLYAGWLRFPPAIPHARLMVCGFLGAFVIGFLGTALPRMLSAPRLRVCELVGLLGVYGAAVFCYATGRVPLGDVCFLILTFSFLVAMAVRRIFFGKENPPFEFGVAVLGVVCAVVGLAWQIVGESVGMGAFGARFSALLLYQGFTILPILGIAGFMAPRFLGEESTGRRAGSGVETVTAAVLILISLGLEAAGWGRIASGLKLAVVLAYFLRQTRLLSRTGTRGSLAFALRVSVLSLIVSFAFGVIWPNLRIGVEHIAFVSGFGLTALTVAARVALGHSGNSGHFFARNRAMRWIVGLALLAMSTRVSADFFPQIMVSHHNYAAALWAAVVVVWLIWLMPKLLVPDPEADSEEG